MIREQIIKIPITYVNEEFTTFKAAKFIELYNLSKEGNKSENILNKNNKEVYIY